MIAIGPAGFSESANLAPLLPEGADAKTIKLGPQEQVWLFRMASKPSQRISRMMDEPPIRTMNSLVKKGLAKDIMSTFWELTELGKHRCNTIS